MTPGGLDESCVPAAQRLAQVVDLPKRVELLTKTTSAVIFAYISQVRLFTLVRSFSLDMHICVICDSYALFVSSLIQDNHISFACALRYCLSGCLFHSSIYMYGLALAFLISLVRLARLHKPCNASTYDCNGFWP